MYQAEQKVGKAVILYVLFGCIDSLNNKRKLILEGFDAKTNRFFFAFEGQGFADVLGEIDVVFVFDNKPQRGIQYKYDFFLSAYLMMVAVRTGFVCFLFFRLEMLIGIPLQHIDNILVLLLLFF